MNPELKEHIVRGNFVNLKDSKMFYIEEGKGEPIVFVHGWLSSSFSYRNVLARLGKKYRAIAVDLPGIGFSPRPNYEISHRILAKSLGEFLDTMFPDEPVHLVVHDYGGPIAFLLLNDDPKKLKSLTVVSSFLDLKNLKFYFPVNLFRIPILGNLFSRIMFGGLLKIIFKLFLFSNPVAFTSDIADSYVKSLFSGESRRNFLKYCKNVDKTIHAQRDMENGIKKMVGLRQILVGESDHCFSGSQTEYLMEIMRISQPIRLKSGHFPMEECVEDFCSKIENLVEAYAKNATRKKQFYFPHNKAEE